MSSVTLTVGLGFGDEGKGTTIDFLARRDPTRLVVRYNGGAQAAHNVVDMTAAGERHHTFAQLGSASFLRVPTLLSRHVLVNPIALFAEARALRAIGVDDPLSLVRIEEEALVTTPFHIAANRLREMSRSGRNGSCGMGIGETMADSLAHPDAALMIRDLKNAKVAREKLEALRLRMLAAVSTLSAKASSTEVRERVMLEDAAAVDACLDAYATFAKRVLVVSREWLPSELAQDGQILFEGAQGLLLDQDFGFQPHTTWTDITLTNARDLLEDFPGIVTRLGILRAYSTRHGAGPFVTEDAAWNRVSAHDHNAWGEWQGAFRSGPLDLVATLYALDVLGAKDEQIDALVITNLDRLALVPSAATDRVPICTSYDGADGRAFFDARDRIHLRTPCDLDHQARLTTALADVRPMFEECSRDHYAAEIAARLNLPLAITSFGSRARDKSIVLPSLRVKRERACFLAQK